MPPFLNYSAMPQKQPLDAKQPKGLPWWLHIILAILVYTGCKYILPHLAAENVFLNRIGQASPAIAPIGAIIFLLLAANALYSSTPEDDENEPPARNQDDDENDDQ